MFLKQVDILGFKSFGRKATFRFQEGMTCIIGPNGCGKSNFTDAIRWVFGENKGSYLRTKNNQDILFQGTDKKSASNVAEVSCTFSSQEGEDVIITRRYFRNGDGEYRLNKKRVLFKEVRKFFSGTGLGEGSYFIFEQGGVERFLQASLSQRRQLFEEASGIGQYRIIQKETVQEMAKIKDNIERLEDILKEVDQQKSVLEKEALHAKKYIEIQAKMDQSGEVLFASSIYQVYNDWFRVQKRLIEQEANEQYLQGNITLLEKDFEQVYQEEQRIQQEEIQLKQEEAKAYTEISLCEKQVEFQKSKIQREQQELEASLERQKIFLEQEQELIQQRKHEINTLQKIEQEQRSLIQEEGIWKARHQEASDKYQKEKEIYHEKESSWNKSCLELKALENKQEILIQQQNEVKKESLQWKEFCNQSQQKYQEITEKSENNQLEITKYQEKYQEIKNQEQRIQKEYNQIKEKYNQIDGQYKTSLSQKESLLYRYDTLKKLDQDLVGASEQICNFFSEYLSKEDRVSATLFSDLIQVKKGYEDLVERALESVMWTIVVPHLEDIYHIRNYYGDLSKGLAFYAYDMVLEQQIILDTKGTLVLPIQEVLIYSQDNKNVVENLTGSIYLAKDHIEAYQFYRANQASRIEVLEESGNRINTCGSIVFEPTRSIIFKRKNDIVEVEQGLEIIEKNQNQILKERHDLEDHLTRIDQSLNEIKGQKEKLERFLQQLEKDYQQYSLELKEVYIRKEEQSKNYNKLEQQELKINADLNKNQDEIQWKQKEQFEKKEQYEQYQHTFQVIEQEKLKVEEKQKEVLQQLAVIQDKIYLQKGQQKKTNQSFLKMEENKRSHEDWVQKTRHNIKQLQEDYVRFKERIIMANEACNSKLEQLAEVGKRLQEVEQKAVLIQADLKEEKSKCKHVSKKIQEDRIRTSRLKENTHHLFDKLKNNEVFNKFFHFEKEQKLEQLEQQFLEDKAVLNIEQVNQTLNQYESLSMAQEDFFKSKKLLEGFGLVNLKASQDYNKVKDRFSKLKDQLEDLSKALQDSQSALNQIEQNAQEQFLENFDQIQQRFKELCEILFGIGCEAQLVLEKKSSDSVLEAGIDILVSPSGKKMKQLSLLSGGEKTLVILALLFAFFSVNPSPFCIFDEVDAPLDDKNIQRWLRLIEEYKKKSLFIVVTHNKITTKEANFIHGITMIEKGISHVESVLVPTDEYFDQKVRN